RGVYRGAMTLASRPVAAGTTALTHRERWRRALAFQPVDHVPDEEFGYWDDTLRRWHEEGLPREIDTNAKADVYFGFAPRRNVPVNVHMLPGFRERILEETGEHVLKVDADGATCLVNRSGASTIPRFLRYAIAGRADWEALKARFDPADPRRYPADWDPVRRALAASEAPVGVNIGSLFGKPRNWIGFEQIALLCYDDPGLIEEIVAALADCIVGVLERTFAALGSEVRVDYGAGWEDICFNSGPLISPAMARRFLLPHYRRIGEVLRRHGCEVAYTDCDGNILELIPIWHEAGIHGIFPIEVRAGSDPVLIRERWGREIVMLGGFDKMAFLEGREGLRREMARIAPYVREGGWIPHVDHRVPADVSLADYRYYLALKRDTFGIPEPAPYEERRPPPIARGAGAGGS
ncbi:MAG TPA: uroporphyrinogen decarboxylase family protein, partial [Chloroflexota bacterium]|nr:uroporphyrinogen decarboxylase family protein [Chloroflexota bacterium]